MALMPGFVGGAYTSPTRAANVQRCINLLCEVDQAGGKTTAALVGMPGLRRLANYGDGPVRALIEVNGKLYAAIGQAFGRISEDFATFSPIGTYAGTGRIRLVSNGIQVLVVDGVSGFVYDVDLMTWTQITDPGFVYGATQADFQDGYGIVALPNSQQFGISNPYNFLAWDPVDFASAEGLPDNVATVVSHNRYLHVFGTRTLELWVNTGGSSANAFFPFERIGGTFFEVGCIAPDSAVVADDSVFWLGTNKQGGLGVFRMQGQAPQRISPLAIEREFMEYARTVGVADAFGMGIDIGRHPIYAIVFPAADKAWIYDAHSAGLYPGAGWSEWLEWSAVDWHRTRANCFASAHGRHIVGDASDGRIYELDFDTFTNDGDPLRALRHTAYTWDEGKGLRHARLEVFTEAGVGLPEGYGSVPELTMRFSDDGRTWSNEYRAPIGPQGAWHARAVFNRLGQSRNRVYEVAYDAPTKRAFLGASLSLGA